jgi:hypothetical protein
MPGDGLLGESRVMSSRSGRPWLLVLDIAIPVALFYGLRAAGVSNVTALLISTVPALISSVASLVRQRRADLVGTAVIFSLVGSAVVAWLGGDARILLVRGAWISLPFAGVTLWSLRHPQPLCYTFTRAIMPRRAAIMDRLWDEDPRFIARRLVISASEDIGMGDPTALGVAVAAADAVQLIGMPEARINLAQAVVALALAPKSNAVIMAVDAAIADVKAGKVGPVPSHLRDAHYAGAKKIGHGSSYQYSHDDPRGIVPQQYAPDVIDGTDYYQPTRRGGEAAYADRVANIRKILRDRK